MRKVLFTIVGVAIATSVVAAQTPDPAKVAAGQKAFDAQKCATCHAVKGQGGKLASALDGVGAKVPAADIKKWLTNPAEMEAQLKTKPKMLMSTYLKSHKLTDADIDALTNYMLSLK
ncbi:MAG TPA: cytochrome c [Vicinamibacterales bacterium]|nr:cytochrome c [Vicinamibacterales bacterium]